MEDIIDYTIKFNLTGLALFLDFEKALDYLEWNFMDQCLKKIGFSENFCTWISTIYTNPIACIKVNGYLTEHIKISRGVKQGCPLSALLFIIATEILCRYGRYYITN